MAKESFIAFKESPHVVFSDEVSSLYAENLEIEEAPDTNPGGPLAVWDLMKGNAEDVHLYPLPVNRELHISLQGFAPRSGISIYNFNGRLIGQFEGHGSEVVLDVQPL